MSFQAEVNRLTALVEDAAKKNHALISIGSKCPTLLPLIVVLRIGMFLRVVSL
jgi:hypothetical protein